MKARDPLGPVEFAVLEAVHRGALRHRRTVGQVPALHRHPAGEAILHRALRLCELEGLVRGSRDASGRRYELTAAGRARLRADRRFRTALVRALLGGQRRSS
jgi:DNA-binding PadR family transcriptional regulator